MSGEWREEERIPSVRELSVRLAVNTHTVLKAYEYLQDEGIIYPRRGMGFYLAEKATEMVAKARREEFFQTTLDDVFREMEMLGISIDDIVKHYRDSHPDMQ